MIQLVIAMPNTIYDSDDTAAELTIHETRSSGVESALNFYERSSLYDRPLLKLCVCSSKDSQAFRSHRVDVYAFPRHFSTLDEY